MKEKKLHSQYLSQLVQLNTLLSSSMRWLKMITFSFSFSSHSVYEQQQLHLQTHVSSDDGDSGGGDDGGGSEK